ncbi:MAG: transketolase [Candidatus Jacksonbacteria bacterium RIFOXYC2_FULL_44_29]|nr:MAG: transketolase [Candidatus Jacksonbacteria bacterium RIFOXYA2_FULL_43_12]OGY76762.1 MAG: transketolase [Candidatus Jacksonbacteria bacterium RIFOXYB2_FULL_44_15]OGY79168.1 MAG: transketolase [Candidatus Jacksonbacteria bacterium RIFOXYC2_FULL_44_29]OGY82113.1 MAG: transketolase [Candidatus Jacksonbacteria bacterium RIFOXYD2_FULL_43_21]HCC50201.1 transketolase [Candidatus Jacksonbacteria bacterium]
MLDENKLAAISRLVRYYILTGTTAAGSGHPSSSLSAVELMTALMFGGFFNFDLDNPENSDNDRLIFSKGHAAPLLYALFAAAGKVTAKEILTLRQKGSRLAGHPMPAFPFTEAATGSLGQGLSIGVGMAMAARLDQKSYCTYVLMGDSEMAEGSVWEAIEIAEHYQLNNLIGIIDVNGLGQRGETLYGQHPEEFQRRVAAFGWETIVVDGHSFPEVISAYAEAKLVKNKPVMIIAGTIKGKGVKLMEGAPGWHGKALDADQLKAALVELGEVDKNLRGVIAKPEAIKISNFPTYATSFAQGYGRSKKASAGKQFSISNSNDQKIEYSKDQLVATRKAYGNALVRIFPQHSNIVVLDAETSNSTGAEIFKNKYPENFIECYIAEQNMVGMAVGLARRGKMPFVSTFAAFLTRAFDQIRMSQYSDVGVKYVGSHAGVSIGPDGPSQMGLEDLAMFRALLGSVVLYPADAVSADKLVEIATQHAGIVYLRTTRADTPIIYQNQETFRIGGSKILRESPQDQIAVVAAGITVHEALAAADTLARDGICIRVIDAYSIKPLDADGLLLAALKTRAVVTVEDHFAEGGLGEAVAAVLAGLGKPIYSLAVRKLPPAGQPSELLDYEEISRYGIIKIVKEIVSQSKPA